MPLRGIFRIISLNTSRTELRIDSALLNVNREIAKRAKRAKIFGRLKLAIHLSDMRYALSVMRMR